MERIKERILDEIFFFFKGRQEKKRAEAGRAYYAIPKKAHSG